MEEEIKLQEELLDGELSERQLEEKLLLCPLDEQLELLQLFEMLFKLELSPLLEQQGLVHDDDGELHEILVDKELSE